MSIPFAYDLTLMRPGCVLLQAAFGGSIAAANAFPSESWLIAPTPDMHLYDIPEDQLLKAIQLAKIQYGGFDGTEDQFAKADAAVVPELATTTEGSEHGRKKETLGRNRLGRRRPSNGN